MRFVPSRISATFAIAAVTTLLLASGCSQGTASHGPAGASADAQPLIFSAVPNQQAAAFQQSFQPILDMLEKETGRQIRFVSATSYDAVIEGLRDDEFRSRHLARSRMCSLGIRASRLLRWRHR